MKTIYHRDGTVTIWNSLTQSWIKRATSVRNNVLATFSWAESDKIRAHVAQS